MRTATIAAGDYFVDISSLCQDAANYAYSEPPYADAKYATFNSHPGDTGMAAHCQFTIPTQWPRNSVPEPGPLLLLSAGPARFCLPLRVEAEITATCFPIFVPCTVHVPFGGPVDQ